MKEIRPIACCNVIYKVISKILCARISQSQSAFVHDRSIADNILLMQEIVRGYHKDRGSPRCAIKVDLQKAYDSASWSFLQYILADA